GAGGAAGAAVEGAIGEENAPSVKEGAMRGLTAGLLGEGSGALLNATARTMLQNTIRRAGNPQAASMMIQQMAPDLAAAAASQQPRDIFAATFGSVGREVKNRLWSEGMDEVANRSAVKTVALPRVAKFLQKYGIDSPQGGIYPIRDALNTLGDL